MQKRNKEPPSQAHSPRKGRAKRSRRRKTFQTSDAMDTDADPSDTDYVIGQASEEDESLLEADFKQVADNPLTGPLSPICVALQDTFLKSCHTTKIHRYGCVRKDTEGSSVSGGVCIFTSFDVPSSALPLRTSLQAVAVRIHSTSLITVCCLYLPPNAVVHQQDLNNLVDQLPAPFVILGDFNGHSTLWGSVKTNPRGRPIKQVLSDHCLCLLNPEEPTYFHKPTRSFHTLDLAICSQSLLPNLNFSVEMDLYNSYHFPVVLSHDYDLRCPSDLFLLPRGLLSLALIGIGGEPKSVKRLRSGDLLIETTSALQTKSFLLAKSFLNSPVTVSPHKSLNSCRGVISEPDLLGTSDSEILEETETRSHTTPDKLNSLSTENLPESVPNTSNSEHSNAPEIPQCVKRKSRNRRKLPNVQKLDIEIKMAPHRSKKAAPTEITTDDEDMITYDVEEEEELEQDPPNKFTIDEDPLNFPKEYLRALTPSRYRNSRE
ncbi:putative RNA-directed DNA polymerase from transposon X-element [Trichonephila clavipes]|nr:putative RNA-directed DNA polymerase from transposon X-element [Trichonephila clavipes]